MIPTSKPKRKKNQSMRAYKDSTAYQKYKVSSLPDQMKVFKVNRSIKGENQVFWVRALNAAEAQKMVKLATWRNM